MRGLRTLFSITSALAVAGPVAGQCGLPIETLFGDPNQPATLGAAVDVSGDVAVAGGSGSGGPSATTGTVEIYEHDGVRWESVAQFFPTMPFATMRVWSVSTDGTWVVAGLMLENRALVYRRSGGKWALHTSLNNPLGDSFGGIEVGNYVLSIYQLVNDVWVLDQTLVGPIGSSLGDPRIGLEDGLLAIGTPHLSNGRVDIYRYGENETWNQLQTLFPPDPAMRWFGGDVAVNEGRVALSTRRFFVPSKRIC